MIRALPLILVVILVLAVGSWVIGWSKAAVARRPSRRGSSRTGGYEFDSRIHQAKRRLKGVAPAPDAPPGAIEEFMSTHQGVEAYVEPETVISPRSVVLVDVDGGWRRFPLPHDATLRRLTAERGISIFDAGRTGYPQRMRRGPEGPTA